MFGLPDGDGTSHSVGIGREPDDLKLRLGAPMRLKRRDGQAARFSVDTGNEAPAPVSADRYVRRIRRYKLVNDRANRRGRNCE